MHLKFYTKILFLLLLASLFGCTKLGNLAGQKDPDFLSTPINLIAVESVDATAMYLSWTPVKNARSYLVFQSDSKDGEYQEIAQVSASYFAFTDASPANFYYKVQAKAGATLSEISKEAKGANLDLSKKNLLRAYLVPLVLNHYTDNKNGTITDNKTGLTWQKCNVEVDYDIENNKCEDHTYKSYAYVEAQQKCRESTVGGRSDWRLPEINEILTLFNHIEDGEEHHSINLDFFSYDDGGYVWSNTEKVGEPELAWAVFLPEFMFIADEKTNNVQSNAFCVAP